MAGFGIRKSLADPILEQVYALDNRGIHNFSQGLLRAYFQLEAQAGKQQVQIIKPGILHLSGCAGTHKHKTFVFSSKEADLKLLSEIQQIGAIYSIDKLPGLAKESGFKELCYDFATVFDPASYPVAKKRHQRIKYPFAWLEKEGFTFDDLKPEDMPEVTKLHDEWAAKKLDDPKVFKMMFPGKRYLRCAEIAMASPKGFVARIARYLGRIVACRVVSVQAGRSYDLAFFGEFYNLPSQAITYCNIRMMKDLYESGITSLNCGYVLNKHLHAAKAHYPNFEVISYAYSMLKPVAEIVGCPNG